MISMVVLSGEAPAGLSSDCPLGSSSDGNIWQPLVKASTRASEAEARRLGLDEFFAEYAGMSGAVAVLDGGSRELRALVGGNRSPAEYRAAIEASFAGRPGGAR